LREIGSMQSKSSPKGHTEKSSPASSLSCSTPKQVFSSTYQLNGGTYGTAVWAKDAKEAKLLAAKRKLGETTSTRPWGLSPPTPHRLKSLIEKEDWVEAAHEATFLCFVGLSSGKFSIKDTVSDDGLIHELLHMAIPRVYESPRRRAQMKAKIAKLANRLEKKCPGWVPSK